MRWCWPAGDWRESPGRPAFCGVSRTNRRKRRARCWIPTCCSARRPVRRSPPSSAAVWVSTSCTPARWPRSRPRSTRASTSTTSPSCSSTRCWSRTRRPRRSCNASGRSHVSTATVSEAVRRDVIAQRLPSHDWPDRDLRITAIDIGTGELVAFDRKSGVELVDAVAASCAVPGAWPPVTIGERRYMDGGVGSTMNLKLVADCDAAVVLVPSGKDSPSPFGGDAARRGRGLPRAALGVFADESLVAAFGPNPLDPACREPSARAGRAQGRRVAAEVADFLARLIRLPARCLESHGRRARGGQLVADVDDLGGAVELQAAASGSGHLDQQIGRVVRPACGGPARPGRCRWCGSSPRSCPVWAPTPPWRCRRARRRCRVGFGIRACVPNRLSMDRPVGVSSRDRAALVSSSEDVLRHILFSHSVVRPRLGFGRLVAAAGLAAAQADRDGEVGVDRRDRRHRQRVEDAAVGEQASVEHMRCDDAGNRDGCPDRRVDGAALQPHRLAGDQVGRHRGVGDRQLFDGDLAEDVADRVEDLRRPAARRRR